MPPLQYQSGVQISDEGRIPPKNSLKPGPYQFDEAGDWGMRGMQLLQNKTHIDQKEGQL